MLSPLVMGTLVLFLLGAVAGLLLQTYASLANRLNSGFALLGSLAGVVAAIKALAQDAPIDGQLWLLGSVHLGSFYLDTLSALMLLVITLVGVAVSLYSFAYIREYQGKGDVAIGVLMNLFLFAMVGMVLADNALGFLLCYELVTLTTYWLVKTNPEAAKQSRLYLVMNHIGMALVLVAFWLLCRESGSLEFAALREHHLAGTLASLVFLLSFCGFGLRAGFVPLHGWLPVAEPVAPSHISALMSGVMVKLGLFGILRVSIDFLGASQLWWGYMVLIFGACSAVLGVLFALAEHDLKRLLAYHTVENIGIILMGMGIGMIGIANQQPVLVVLGLLGALYHLLNHAIFKSLLFMGTGSVMFRLHTRDMDKMGGLAKLMPWTALAFLIGAMAISALPPLNGFVSEWFIYQALLSMTRLGTSVVAPLAVVMLAVTGAMAVMCFVKVYGICFCGSPRSEKASQAREVPHAMVAGTLLLAAACLVLGLGAPWIAPFVSGYGQALVSAHVTGQMSVATGATLLPLDSSQAILSPPVIAITLFGLFLIPLLVVALFKGPKLGRRHAGTPWACGYAYEERMSLTSGGVTHTLRQLCAPLYRKQPQLDLATALHGVSASSSAAGWLLHGLVLAFFILMAVGV
ncbi:hydrogenase 4 subunit B [Aeromonas sp. HMWF014]|uniref:hydrogenase 4 subunit B n=1 Tax=Aeromonas sp. HMWF014 TaxID=2056850 RepID=UPI000D3D07C6|nr:hydrogenase 4 subunit B [Aeromonas sp. HMWF014]PTT53549.1 hydrogenase 4 subunit B [Aeromonas sp. HMWF014]